MQNYMLIIDGSSLLATSYYGILPPQLKTNKLSEEEAKQFYPNILHTSDGKYTNAIYGFMKALLSIIQNQDPRYIVVNWDANRSKTFRRDIYSEYKGNRGKTPIPLKEQQEMMKQILKFIGIKQFFSDKFEADDFSGSLAKYFEKDTYIRILTKDRDHLQLVDDKINIWLTFPVDKDGISKHVNTLNTKYKVDVTKLNIPSNVFRITKDIVEPFYGAKAERIVDLKALMGDTADNIPGVVGIGEKTASLLIKNFDTIEVLYSYIETNSEEDIIVKFKDLGIRSGKKVLAALTAQSTTEIVGKQAALLSKELATIKTDINFGNLDISVFERNINETNMIASLKRLEFNSLLTQYYPNN